MTNRIAIGLALIGIVICISTARHVINPLDDTRTIDVTFDRMYKDEHVRTNGNSSYYVIHVKEYPNPFYLQNYFYGALKLDEFKDEMSRSRKLTLTVSGNTDLSQNNSGVYGVRNDRMDFLDPAKLKRGRILDEVAGFIIGIFFLALAVYFWKWEWFMGFRSFDRKSKKKKHKKKKNKGRK